MADGILLYLDTSALLDRALGQKRYVEIGSAMREHAAQGGRLVSSRLLHLEVRRIEVRELLAGRDIARLGRLAQQVNPLPVTEEVWQAAYDLEVHVKTLDAMHLATCLLVKGELLASDHGMLTAAEALGIPIHSVSGTG